MVGEERIRAGVWGVVLGVLATAAALTFLVLCPRTSPAEDANATSERQARRSEAQRARFPTGGRSSGGSRLYSRERFTDAGVALTQEQELALRDPQMAASQRSYPETDGGVPASFAPMMRIAHVTEVAGDTDVAVGDRCEVRVLPVAAMQFNCLARVQCGNALLYPDPSQHAGYVACELSDHGFPSRASDYDVTGTDGDPVLLFDLPHHRVVVRDGGGLAQDFSAVLTLDPLPRFTRTELVGSGAEVGDPS